MIKVVTTSLILIVLLGTTSRLSAQNSAAAQAAAASQAAGEEAVRRQGKTIQLRSTLAEAQALQSRGETVDAARRFEEAYELVQSLGVNIEQEQAATVQGLTETRLELAKMARARSDLNEADEQLKRILRVNPASEEAAELKKKNDRDIQDRLGTQPSAQTLELLPGAQQQRINTSILVNDARLLMEMGKLDEAEAKLVQAAKADPENKAAFYYMHIIKERRYAQEARKREVMAKDRIVEVETAWNTPIARDTLPTPNIYARTNRIYTSSGRQAIARKLDTIILDEFTVPGEIPLTEVIKELSREVELRDPQGRGLNFIISSHLDKPGPLPLAAGGFGGFPGGNVDPLTGLPVAPTASEQPVMIEEFYVKFDPPLKNVRVADVLDAIVLVAKPPPGQDQNVSIKYSIEDYAIVFSQAAIEAESLYNRTFKVDPNTFTQGLDAVFLTQNTFVLAAAATGTTAGGGGAATTAGSTAGGVGPGGYFTFSGSIPGQQAGQGGGGGGGGQGGGIIGVTLTNNMASIQDAVRTFFSAAGVDFATNQNQNAQPGIPNPPQKALFFNDRTGVLFVRATLRDLDIIEGALHALNITPPQVTIEVKIAEITQRDNKGVGFDWFLGNVLMGGGKAGFQGGTAPSFAGEPTTANPGGTFPGEFGFPAQLPNAETDQLITSGLRNNASLPAVGSLTGILTDPQFKVVIRALEQREGVDLLSAPKITTVSGRQARISIEDTQTIVIGLDVQALGGGGVGGAGAGGFVQ